MSTDAGVGYARIAFSPPASAVREFKMQTTAYDASIGHTIGAVVNVNTASGTNELHGEAHYALRHSALDAPNFFNNKRGTKKGRLPGQPLRRIGGRAAGACRTCIAARTGLSGSTRSKTTGRSCRTCTPAPCPRRAERKGNFSELLRLRRQLPDLRPLDDRRRRGRALQPPAYSRGTSSRRAGWTESASISWLSTHSPTSPARSTGGTITSLRARSASIIYQHLLRLDHAFSENHRVFLRLHYDFWKEHKNDDFGNDINRHHHRTAPTGARPWTT